MGDGGHWPDQCWDCSSRPVVPLPVDVKNRHSETTDTLRLCFLCSSLRHLVAQVRRPRRKDKLMEATLIIGEALNKLRTCDGDQLNEMK